MNKHAIILLFIGVLFVSGCYNARVTTGLTPSAQTIEVKWAHGFLAGLVPPSALNVAQDCPSGVAIVETKLSFLNLVANAITFGLYSPMEITVTCAASTADIPADAPFLTIDEAKEKDHEAIEAMVQDAIKFSSKNSTPVYLALGEF